MRHNPASRFIETLFSRQSRLYKGICSNVGYGIRSNNWSDRFAVVNELDASKTCATSTRANQRMERFYSANLVISRYRL
jgi:hypothetical protein